MPAIIPRIEGIPAFTSEDVKLHYQSHFSFSTGPSVSCAPPTIESIKFITSGEAQVLMNGTKDVFVFFKILTFFKDMISSP
jgi:hypothetical protein